MTTLAVTILDRAEESLGQALPRVGGALLLVIIGVPLAVLFARFVQRLLVAARLDDLGERTGLHDGLSRLGLDRSVSRVVGRGVRIALIVVVLIAAISLLGLPALDTALNTLVLFVPKFFVAVAIVIAGVAAAEFLRRRVDAVADQMAIGAPLGQLTQATVLTLFVLTALALVGVPTGVVLALLALVIAAGVFAIALAFGLGGREVAREISAGRSIGSVFRVGERITVEEVTGVITSLDNVSTVIRADDGTSVRVPNHLLVESIVRVHEAGASAAPGGREPA